MDLTNCDILLNRSSIGLVHPASRGDAYFLCLLGSAAVRWPVKPNPLRYGIGSFCGNALTALAIATAVAA